MIYINIITDINTFVKVVCKNEKKEGIFIMDLKEMLKEMSDKITEFERKHNEVIDDVCKEWLYGICRLAEKYNLSPREALEIAKKKLLEQEDKELCER